MCWLCHQPNRQNVIFSWSSELFLRENKWISKSVGTKTWKVTVYHIFPSNLHLDRLERGLSTFIVQLHLAEQNMLPGFCKTTTSSKNWNAKIIENFDKHQLLLIPTHRDSHENSFCSWITRGICINHELDIFSSNCLWTFLPKMKRIIWMPWTMQKAY